jgi:hypothetical protein
MVHDRRRWAWGLGVVALLSGWWGGCRLDPVMEKRLDKLPPEDPEGPSELHRAGQPCALCHSAYKGANPAMAIGGTVYQQDPDNFIIKPIEGVFVTIYDSAGASQKACTNAAGNFFVRLDDWPDAKFPFTVQVGNRFMRSLIGRDRSCATCHVLATQARVDDPNDNVNPLTGASRFSAGAVLVDPAAVPPEQTCGPNPASSSASSGGGGTGGQGGAGG